MAGLKIRFRDAPAAGEVRRVPQRGLETVTDEPVTKKPRIDSNEDSPSHFYPLRTWEPIFGSDNVEVPKQPNEAMKAPFAIQQGWAVPDNMLPGFTHSEKTITWGTLNSTEMHAQQVLSSTITSGDTSGINPEIDGNNLGVQNNDEDKNEVEIEDSGDEVEAVIAGVRHFLANPQPLVPPDWNQRIVDKKIKRGLRFIARRY